MVRRARVRRLCIAAFAGVAAFALVPAVAAQLPPIESSTTSTAAGSGTGSPTTSTTAAPSSDLGDPSSTPAPPGAQQGGDGGEPAGAIVVPPGAQAIIDSVVRTGSNSSERLMRGVRELVQLGADRDEAIRVAFGRFPVAGHARYSHDWLYPRYGPGFRFHLGCDVVAEYGTPLRSAVDGIAQSSTSALGGLSVKVFMPDGTFFYYAHLSALVEGFEQNMPVKTGDIIGYIGDSGNARGGVPHVHFAVHPHGGPPIDPKPVLDDFLADAEARLPEVIAHFRDAKARSAPEAPRTAPTVGRGFAATELLLPLVSAGEAEVPTELLYATSANPVGGGLELAERTAADLAAGIDWTERSEAYLQRQRLGG